jgi:hypothetical protein
MEECLLLRKDRSMVNGGSEGLARVPC